MKTKIFSLSLLLLFASVITAQTLEFRTITQDAKIPKWIMSKKQMRFSDIEVLDTVDNYLICRKPVFLSNTRQYLYTETFLLDTGLQDVKTLELPKEYAKFTPVYLCRVGGNHFVKLRKGFKKYSLALFDQHMNFIKAEPMENFGFVCKDDQYIYIHNSPIKSKTYDGELIKMDKDMNVVMRKPITVLFDSGTFRQEYSAVDTLGHIVFRNRGTYMCIDRETLDQIELDLIEPIDYYTRILNSFRNFDVFEADKVTHITSYASRMMNVRSCDYQGHLLSNQTFQFPISYPMYSYLDYRNNKMYFSATEDQTVSIYEHNLATGINQVVYSYNLGLGRTLNKNSSHFATLRKYNNGTSNLIVEHSEPYNVNARDNTWRYNKYVTYLHLDENFKPTHSVETKNYNGLYSSSLIFDKILHSFDDFTLMQHAEPVKNSRGLLYDLEFCIWDKTGQMKSISTGIRYNTLYVDIPNKPVFLEISPKKYYILVAVDKETCKLIEMTVK